MCITLYGLLKRHPGQCFAITGSADDGALAVEVEACVDDGSGADGTVLKKVAVDGSAQTYDETLAALELASDPLVAQIDRAWHQQAAE